MYPGVDEENTSSGNCGRSGVVQIGDLEHHAHAEHQ